MSLDGLRAWIGEVERKLGARTRVFLVLTAIAVGGAGAAIYLSLDAQSNQVSEGDLEAFEAQIQEQATQLSADGATAGENPKIAQLEAQIKVLQAKVEALEGGGKGKSGDGPSVDNGQFGEKPGLEETPSVEKDGGTGISP